jgi:hypothetical protein
MMIVAKMNGKLVEVVRVADTVAFAPERGWVLICTDFEVSNRRKTQFKWVPASTRFEWVRSFDFESAK